MALSRCLVLPFKQGVDNVLLLFHIFFTLFQPITLALNVDDGAVMKHTIKDGRGNCHIGKNLVPLREGLVGGKDGGHLLVAPCDELKEQVSPLNIHWQIADLIDDEQFVFAEDFQLVGQAVFKMSLFELLY